jgi:hypothetical protein
MPLQLAAVAISFLVASGAGKLGVPRWSFAPLGAVFVIGLVIVGAYFLALLAALAALVLFGGAVVGWIAASMGTRRDGDIALAIFVGYAIGQCVPTVF